MATDERRSHQLTMIDPFIFAFAVKIKLQSQLMSLHIILVHRMAGYCAENKFPDFLLYNQYYVKRKIVNCMKNSGPSDF